MNEIKTLTVKKNGRTAVKPYRPFWLPASNYYILAAAAAITFFFLVWGVLREGEDETPWIPAGIGASVILGSAVFLREVVLRKAQNKFLLAQKRLDSNLSQVPLLKRAQKNENKFTVEKNARIIKDIQQKSEAARLLARLPDAHREVFEVCDQYLSINRKELETVGVGSPRLPALIRGREIVGQIHKFHLLAWAKIEAKSLTQQSKNQVKITEKIANAQKALNVIESALAFYPNESQLQDSENALKNFVASIKISHLIEQAKRARFKENYKRAKNLYQDALFVVSKENIDAGEREQLIETINAEIEKIRQFENTTKNINNASNNQKEIKNGDD